MKSKTLYTAIPLIFAALVALFFVAQSVSANITVQDAGAVNEWREYNFFHASSTDTSLIGATTTQATSTGVTYMDSNGRVDNGYIVLKGADAVTLWFTRYGASNSTATSTFSVQVSPDGTTWVDYNKLISNTTNTNAQMLTRVGSVQIVGATSTTMVSMDMGDAIYAVRCIANFASTTVETTDSNECRATVNY